jgi:hypothetical protein
MSLFRMQRPTRLRAELCLPALSVVGAAGPSLQKVAHAGSDAEAADAWLQRDRPMGNR